MKRKILLLEPNYKNKYPPLGLMKLATYYKMLKDDVYFYKGDFNTFVIQEITEDAIKKLKNINKNIEWRFFYGEIFEYIKFGREKSLIKLNRFVQDDYPLFFQALQYYRKYYKNNEYFKKPKWDRVHVATLFTFYWKQTIETVEFAKKLVKDLKEVYAGGVLASVVPNEFEKATNVKPTIGLLNYPGAYDDNDIIIDELPLDYSILDEIDYSYPESGSYYGYMTRGCINKCPFCAVPIIEPKYNSMLPVKEKIDTIKNIYGEQKNLLLLDNNVLASKKFKTIIDEIIESGFERGAKFNRPNYLDISIQQLKRGYNERANIKKSVRLLNEFLDKLHGNEKQNLYDQLEKHHLFNSNTATKQNILSVYSQFRDLYEKRRSKLLINRYVDFNQGLDARLMTEDKVELLSKIAINPLRVAFDDWKLKDTYEKAIRLAAKHGIKHLSNYLLYNFKDEPIELYNRLKMNVELSEELGVKIYSFPMKYHPIMDPNYFQNRDYIGEKWNRKYIRSIQAVLNSTKGKIGTGLSFFFKAFGSNEEEFYKILLMPETFIIYRLYFEQNGQTEKWWNAYKKLDNRERLIFINAIGSNKFDNIEKYLNEPNIYDVLQYYKITKNEAEKDIKALVLH